MQTVLVVLGLALSPAAVASPLGGPAPSEDCRFEERLAPYQDQLDSLLTRELPPELFQEPEAEGLLAETAEVRGRVVEALDCRVTTTLSTAPFQLSKLAAVHLGEGWRHLDDGNARLAVERATEIARLGRTLSGGSLLVSRVGLALERDAVALLEAAGASAPALPPRATQAEVLRTEATGQRELRWAYCTHLSTLGDCLSSFVPGTSETIDLSGTRALADATEAEPLQADEPVPALSGSGGVARQLATLVRERAEVDARLEALGEG